MPVVFYAYFAQGHIELELYQDYVSLIPSYRPVLLQILTQSVVKLNLKLFVLIFARLALLLIFFLIFL